MVDHAQSLIAHAQAGDGGAFGELYEHFAPEIFRFLLGRLRGDRAAAEDLTEDVFMNVLQRLGSYHCGGAPFSAWLYRIARNRLIDHIRVQPRQIVSPLETVAEIPEAKAEHALDRVGDQHELAYALGRLTREQRQVIALRFLDGFTTAQTAEVLGKTEDAVKKLQARGLVQMRRLITRSRPQSCLCLACASCPSDSPARVGVA